MAYISNVNDNSIDVLCRDRFLGGFLFFLGWPTFTSFWASATLASWLDLERTEQTNRLTRGYTYNDMVRLRGSDSLRHGPVLQGLHVVHFKLSICHTFEP